VSAALLIRPEAETDLAEAYRWYEDQKEGLGDKFLERVREQFDTIVAMPDIYAVVDRGVRRCKLKRFPYVGLLPSGPRPYRNPCRPAWQTSSRNLAHAPGKIRPSITRHHRSFKIPMGNRRHRSREPSHVYRLF
jgi:plasmid stabilization system protein ParE